MPPHPYGWTCLLPPLVAIALAIATRRVLASLLAGVFTGAMILASYHPLTAAVDTVRSHLWPSLVDGDHLRVFGFTLLMGVMVGIVHRGGGMHGIVDRLSPLARTRRGGQITTWALGLIVFFDDYANTLLLGGTMRPLADRLKISREKLAYLVDSTAAPVSGLAIVSTWIAGELGYIEDGYAQLPIEGSSVDAFGVFMASVPYRFYVLWALAFVPLVGWLNRDFGPMLRAEKRASTRNDRANQKVNLGTDVELPEAMPRRWHNAAIPIGVAVGLTLVLLWVTGTAKVEEMPEVEPTLLNIIGNGNSYQSLLYGSLAGAIAAALWIGAQRLMPPAEMAKAAFRGGRQMSAALFILWFAWSLSTMTGKDHLQTGKYLGSLLEGNVAVHWMPSIVFLLAAAVAFSTGTSWGTMGILMPLVISATYDLLAAGGAADPATLVNHPILIASIGGVLAGAIFGDHCSPISDTTILSSQASGCDHIAHVRTQLPYALLVGACSVLLGTIPVGFGVSPWIMLPIGIAVLAGILMTCGRNATDDIQNS